jgi:putative DNA primase/helicase
MNAQTPPGEDDPFKPFSETDRAQSANKSKTKGEDWQPQLPAPEEPPELDRAPIWRNLTAVARWVYRGPQGEPLFAVYRYNKPDGDKAPVPYCYGRRSGTDSNGEAWARVSWHFKAPKSPIPLYGLDRLAQRPDAPVMVLEGEKTADACAGLFPEFVGVTSQGGSKGARKSDWSPLSGREVTIFGDNDEAGAAYAEDVAALAYEAGATSVRRVVIPSAWNAAPGWDIADQLPLGVALEALREIVEQAEEVEAPSLPDDAQWPPGFRMEVDGLYYHRTESKRDKEPDVRICQAFRVLGRARDTDSSNWHIYIEFKDRSGIVHKHPIPSGLLAGGHGELEKNLFDAGFVGSTDHGAKSLLRQALNEVESDKRLRLIGRPGWYEDAYILADGTVIGGCSEPLVFKRPIRNGAGLVAVEGDLAAWQNEIATPASISPIAKFCIAAAFCGPLIDRLGLPSGGFHLFGKSKIGKTLAVKLAASVWGKPEKNGLLRDWRSTANAMEGAAEESCDNLLILDEIHQASPNEVVSAIYMLANESGKERMTQHAENRPRRTWRMFLLSTGEIDVASKVYQDNKKVMPAGAEVRVPSVPVVEGMWGDKPEEIMRAMHAALKRFHGTAGRAFLDCLMSGDTDASEVKDAYNQMRESFELELPEGADQQVLDVVARFALVATVGEFAIDWGILPWEDRAAEEASLTVMRHWLRNRGGVSSNEDNKVISAVRSMIFSFGTARFEQVEYRSDCISEPKRWLPVEPMRTIPDRIGWKRVNGEDIDFCIPQESWDVFCRANGFIAKDAAKVLDEKGYIDRRDDPKRRMQRFQPPGLGGKRIYVYVIKSSILESDEEPAGAA